MLHNEYVNLLTYRPAVNNARACSHTLMSECRASSDVSVMAALRQICMRNIVFFPCFIPTLKRLLKSKIGLS